MEENGADQENQVHVEGFGTQTTPPYFHEAQESISLSELGSALNMPPEAVRDYIIAQLRDRIRPWRACYKSSWWTGPSL